MSDESGRDEVYVQPYPGPGSKVPVSIEGGREPVWSHEGQELFYRRDNVMMAVAVDAGPTLEVGTERELFEWTYSADDPAFGSLRYDVTGDGQRFLMESASTARSQLNVVLNWFEELKARVPVN